MPMISGPRQTAGKDANASKEDPGLRAGDCLLKIFRQASAAIEPSKCSFDHPALWLRFKCTGTLRSCDDLDKPLAELRERLEQLLPAVHAVSKDVTQLGKDEVCFSSGTAPWTSWILAACTCKASNEPHVSVTI